MTASTITKPAVCSNHDSNPGFLRKLSASRAARKAARRALEDRLARVDAELGSFLDAVDAR
jgi:hypothetical protein